MWTKRALIEEAFGELGLAGYTFDLTPDEQATALRRLDSMMATWEARGVRVGYRMPSGPDESDLDDESGVPDRAAETIYLNLAVRLAPGFGKTIAVDTKTNARLGYEALLFAPAQPIEQQLPVMPSGAGNRTPFGRRVFTPAPVDKPLDITPGGDLEIAP